MGCRQRARGAATAVAALAWIGISLGGPAPVALAAAPNWSGLDARSYDGFIPPAAGTLIDSVPLDPALSLRGAGPAYRIIYSTLDEHNNPRVSTAAVFLPRGNPPATGWPVIAWAHGTVGLGDDCTPSALPRSERDNDYLSHWLDDGYAIAATDYAGLGTPGLMSYLNNISTPHDVVGSVVAMHQLGLPLSPRWAIVGQSQGGGAAVNTARWANEFSRGTGLDYRGVVATGSAVNIERIVAQAGPKSPVPAEVSAVNAYLAYILAAFRDARPDIGIDSILTPAGLQAAMLSQTVCFRPLRHDLANSSPTEFFSAPVNSLPGATEALNDYMGVPVTGYDRPIFLGVGLQDRDVPPESTLSLYKQLSANNPDVDVELHVYPDQDHGGTVLASIADSTPFLHRVFGEPAR
ncbi:prolyl oligopeptidase family serine peptidase [Mycobacterium sp.]|uniref:alpha/beta hydrolase family protein n=1 Tax=Mycobacterium sp. TaxID=1785 RepID=UPI0031D37D7B